MKLAGTTNTNGNIPGAFSPNGSRFAVGVSTGVVHVFDTATGKEVFQIPRLRPGSGARHVRYNPDGTTIYVGNTWGESRLLRSTDGEPAGPVMYQADSIAAAEFSADGTRLVTASNDATAQVWDGHTGAPIGERLRHASFLRAVRITPDGQRVLTASEDKTMRVWDATTSQPLTEPLLHGARVTNAWLSSDGRVAFCFSGSGSFLWSLPPPTAGAKVPDWLLQLATICANKRVTDDGKLVEATGAVETTEAVRRTLAALPDDAPYVEWGRWFLADRATRAIAPGFTITSAEAEKLAASMAAPPAAFPASPPPR